MISTISATTTNRLRPLGIRRQFERLCSERSLARKVCSLDGSTKNSTGMDNDSTGLHAISGIGGCGFSERTDGRIKYQRHSGTSSMFSIVGRKNSRHYSSSTSKKGKSSGESGQDHHAFFQEQLLELRQEQKQLGLTEDEMKNDHEISSSALNSADLEDQLNDWKSEQVEVFGETLADHDPAGPAIPNGNIRGNDDGGSNEGLDPDDRESRFQFTSEDRAAWGKPNPDPKDMQRVLEAVALERKKEADYAKSASLSPSSSSSSKEQRRGKQAEEHHESFSHVSEDGAGVHMVDVGRKATTARTAHARSEVWLPPEVLEAFAPGSRSESEKNPSAELVGPKGPIFATAKIAGIMACKKTSDLIPLCHPLPLDQVRLDIWLRDEDDDERGGTVVIECTCKVTHKTGVEMEALTGATVAALTIYDMTKAVSHNIRIRETRLLGKTGGKRTVLDGVEHRQS
mmetsp:Transcript_4417/g.11401  ORF Transcript_4417/g.11401 Transcript_4417/m.11401 type:complete len:457 (-) Transcript_4417:335-1705(-)